jgi:solute:Na+ symporter, SSS family
VIWTDVVQSLVLTAGMLVTVAILLAGMPGGAGAFLSQSFETGKFSLGSTGPSVVDSTFWVVLLYGLFVNLQNFGIDQSYVQRYATARTDAEATRSVWLGALLYVPISAVLFFIGTALFAFYAGRAEELPQVLVDGTMQVKGDAVFPYFIAHELPVGATGILVAAICAAAMSSVDSSLNGAATLTLYDLAPYVWGDRIPGSSGPGSAAVEPHERATGDDRLAMRILYGATLFWGVLGTGAALAMIRVESALKVWWNLAGMFSGGMLGLFLLGILSRRAGNAAAAIGVAAGVLFIGWASLAGLDAYEQRWFGNPLHENLTIVLGTSTILLVGFLVSTIPASGGR